MPAAAVRGADAVGRGRDAIRAPSGLLMSDDHRDLPQQNEKAMSIDA